MDAKTAIEPMDKEKALRILKKHQPMKHVGNGCYSSRGCITEIQAEQIAGLIETLSANAAKWKVFEKCSDECQGSCNFDAECPISEACKLRANVKTETVSGDDYFDRTEKQL
jgi:hypothetical protein